MIANSADQKGLYTRMLEVYCAAPAHADYQIGRKLQMPFCFADKLRKATTELAPEESGDCALQ